MCGIAGIFSFTKNVSYQDTQKMIETLKHRGPDAHNIFIDNNNICALAHSRLSIIDLSNAANQPMHSHDNRFVVVFNGEIFNFKEIGEKLKSEKNINFNTTSDTEILLEAYVHYGLDFVNLLNGMFVIAIYDKVEEQLIIVRDRIGVKPLYYFNDENIFAFGSEIKALLANTYVASHCSLNTQSIFEFIQVGYIPTPTSIYNQIHKMEAGSIIKIKNKNIAFNKYWQLDNQVESNAYSGYKETKNKLHNLLNSSVQLRMISDVPMGTFLSGGIDSSLVTALAQHNSSAPINTFSIGFNNAKHDESQYAQAVAKHLGTQHHLFVVTENDAIQLVDNIIQAYDEPYADSSALPTMLVSKLAKQHVTMTLSGDGGDELFQGYGMYTWANRLNNIPMHLFRKPISMALSMLNNKYQRAAKVIDYENKSSLMKHIFSQEQYFFNNKEAQEILKNKITNSNSFNEIFSVARKLNPPEKQALFDMHYYLPDDLLVKVDRASMQFSLETRTPFLDYRIVAMALNIPYEYKIGALGSKHILKDILYEYVPAALFDRPKWGFSIPLDKWLQTDLKYLLDQYLSKENIEASNTFDYIKVKALLQSYFGGKTYLYNRIWAILMYQMWYIKIGQKILIK